jgi:predicted ATP-grasp superfamily ATP-dependent carboligase
LRLQAERLLKTVEYSGILDMDYRFDKRDGQYKLLDFNPRIGANFRMFEDCAGLDVARALYLDLTGTTVGHLAAVERRIFVVGPYDLFASLSYIRHGRLTVRAWWRSLRGRREIAWFDWRDPLPFLVMCVRLFLLTAERKFRRALGKASPRRSQIGTDTAARAGQEPVGS